MKTKIYNMKNLIHYILMFLTLMMMSLSLGAQPLIVEEPINHDYYGIDILTEGYQPQHSDGIWMDTITEEMFSYVEAHSTFYYLGVCDSYGTVHRSYDNGYFHEPTKFRVKSIYYNSEPAFGLFFVKTEEDPLELVGIFAQDQVEDDNMYRMSYVTATLHRF